MIELGPDAPTLCAGWTTAQLAVHLVLRARFVRWTDERVAAELNGDYDDLVARVRRPPLVPWRLPGIRRFDAVEYVIHHEDVRRANGLPPRTGVPGLQRLAWRATGFIGRRVARHLRPVGLALVRPDGVRRTFGRAPFVELHGPPVELLLYLAGRKDAAEVTTDGEAVALEALEAADLSM